MTPKQILIAARELISEEEHWTQGVFARSDAGAATPVHNDNAVCFCAVGALDRVSGDDFQDEFSSAIRILMDVLGSPNILIFNDTHTHPEVLALFSKAISSTEGNEA